MDVIESREEFDSRVIKFGKKIKGTREDMLVDRVKQDNSLKFEYKPLEAYAKKHGFDIVKHLADQGFVKLMWYNCMLPRAGEEDRASWASKVGHKTLVELKEEYPECDFFEFEEEAQDGPGGRALEAYTMLQPGDPIQLPLDGGIKMKYMGHTIGHLYSPHNPQMMDLMKHANELGIVDGKPYAEVGEVFVKKSKHGWYENKLTVRIYYGVNAARNREDNGMLISVDGKTLVRFIGSQTKVEIPDGIEVIADSAFQNAGIESVALPSTLKRIGDKAFDGTELKSVLIPSGVEYIGAQAFSYSTTHERNDSFSRPDASVYIEVEDGNKTFFAKGGSLFERNGEKVTLLSLYTLFARRHPGHYVYCIPEGVAHLKSSCILERWGDWNSGSYSVLLPSDVVSVDSGAIGNRKADVINPPRTITAVQKQKNSASTRRAGKSGVEVSLLAPSVVCDVCSLEKLSTYEKEVVRNLKPGDPLSLHAVLVRDKTGKVNLKNKLQDVSFGVGSLRDIGSASVKLLFGVESLHASELEKALDGLMCCVKSVESACEDNGLGFSVRLTVEIKTIGH